MHNANTQRYILQEYRTLTLHLSTLRGPNPTCGPRDCLQDWRLRWFENQFTWSQTLSQGSGSKSRGSRTPYNKYLNSIVKKNERIYVKKIIINIYIKFNFFIRSSYNVCLYFWKWSSLLILEKYCQNHMCC